MPVANIGEFDSIAPDGVGTMMAITPRTIYSVGQTSRAQRRSDVTRFSFGLAHRTSSGPDVKTGGHFRTCNLDRRREVSDIIRTVLTLADNRHEMKAVSELRLKR